MTDQETWTSKRARLNALRRHRATPERLAAAEQDLKATRAESYIKRLVDEAPQLSDEQRDKLAVLLRGAASAA